MDPLQTALRQHSLEARDGRTGLVLRHGEDGTNHAFPWKKAEDGSKLIPVKCNCTPEAPHGVHWIDVERAVKEDRKIVGETYHGAVPRWLVDEYA